VQPRVSRIIPPLVLILVLPGGLASAGEQCEKIVEAFVLSSTRISRDYRDRVERQELLKAARNELVRNARSIYGPFCPCDELFNKGIAWQNHKEARRSPPPGWTPTRFRASFLPLEVEIAREDIRLLSELMSVCNGNTLSQE